MPGQTKAARLAEEAKAGIFDPNLLDGETFIARGEKALGQDTLFAAFPKVEDSIMWYNRAAEAFRKSMLWEEAGDCYRRIAENEKLIGNIEEAGTSYVDSAEMYERVSFSGAIDHYKSAISMFSQVGRFYQAGKYQRQIAHIQTQETHDIPAAIRGYQQAADYYIADGEHVLADACLEEVAEHCALTARYERAAETFEALALRSLQFNLRRFNAKTYYLRAGICTLAAGDAEHARRIRRRHKKQDFMYGSMAECQFLEDITRAYEEDDIHGYMDHIYNFNNFIQLTTFEMTILQRGFDAIAVVVAEKKLEEEEKRRKEEEEIRLKKEREKEARRRKQLAAQGIVI
jgi:alpha-soluble NSF attachment protein